MFKNERSKYLANITSLTALFLSWVSIVFLLNNRFYFSFSLILMAFILDSLDGLIARKLNLETDFGRQLDGHVDVFVHLLYPALAFYLFFGLKDIFSFFIIFIFLSAGIFRLVRFNIAGYTYYSEEKRRAYIGLPVYFNHLLLLLFLLMKQYNIRYFHLLSNTAILTNSYLMLLKFPFPKPQTLWPFIVLLLLGSATMIFLGILYGTY